MAIEVNYEGMHGLRTAVKKNEGYLRDVHTFITDNCNDFGAFTGFLALFKGDYTTAYNNAEGSISKGADSASGIAATIRANVKQYRKDDIESSTRLKKIDVEVQVPTIAGMDPTTGNPIVTLGDKNTASATGVASSTAQDVENLENPHVPKHRWDEPPKGLNPLSPINVASEVESMVNTVKDGSDAGEDVDDYEKFENEGKR